MAQSKSQSPQETEYWQFAQRCITAGILSLDHAQKMAQVGTRKEWAWASHLEKLKADMKEFTGKLGLEPGETLSARRDRLGIRNPASYYAYNLLTVYGQGGVLPLSNLQGWLGMQWSRAISELVFMGLAEEWKFKGTGYVCLAGRWHEPGSEGNPAPVAQGADQGDSARGGG